MKINENRRYRIDQRRRPEGLWELWESKRHGDEVPAIVTLNGEIFTKTWEGLDEFLKEYDEA